MPSKLSYASTLETILSPTEPPQIRAKVDDEQNFDIPLSREEKPEAYPAGPICVYDPCIDLYLEPTAEEARKYDVIMNVASEVRNPFVKHEVPAAVEPDVRLDGGGGIQFAPKRLALASSAKQPSSPTTPKATPLIASFPNLATASNGAEPEYIHIPWEHNSDIVPDLLRLVKLIDEKVEQKKRVLVHCQCGVSRSASLVVAYGLYKNPSLSVQEAYDAVKRKSKWIGPNMVSQAPRSQ
jgi:tyrosine-protein phosphatase